MHAVAEADIPRQLEIVSGSDALAIPGGRTYHFVIGAEWPEVYSSSTIKCSAQGTVVVGPRVTAQEVFDWALELITQSMRERHADQVDLSIPFIANWSLRLNDLPG